MGLVGSGCCLDRAKIRPVNPYARSAIISTTAGGLIGSQGYSFPAAVLTIGVASLAIGAAQASAPGLTYDPKGPVEGQHPALTTMALALMGWWVGSRFFPPPRRNP